MSTFFRFIAIVTAALTVTFLVMFVIAVLIDYHVPENKFDSTVNSHFYLKANQCV
ncbi:MULTISPECIES: hypothetical protein [Shewanella]|uniref:hypothetical protein n=1 Tax=Shewanella TaxID=22 RepID=UPI001BC5BB52|nr:MULTISPECIES: hypothetical protein [Shewanella]GIU53224.1 hypothetical protein TUM4249_28650 [Shewanella sp. KT0246]